MTNVTPIQQPCLESLKNALWIAELGRDGEFGSLPRYDEAMGAFGDIARLLKNVLEALSEPNLSAMQAGEILLKEWSGTPEPQCQLRDTIAGILHAQLTGEIPRTWSDDG